MSWLCKGKLRLSPQDHCGFYLLAVFNVSALSDHFLGSRWVSDAPAETPPRSGVRTGGRRLAGLALVPIEWAPCPERAPRGRARVLPGRGRAAKTSQKVTTESENRHKKKPKTKQPRCILESLSFKACRVRQGSTFGFHKVFYF